MSGAMFACRTGNSRDAPRVAAVQKRNLRRRHVHAMRYGDEGELLARCRSRAVVR